MLRLVAVWAATIFLFYFSGLPGAWAVVVTTEIVTEGEPVPNAEITFETSTGDPVDLFETEEPPFEQASSQVPEPQGPAETTSQPAPEPTAPGTPTATGGPEDTPQVAVPADSGRVSEPQDETASGVAVPEKKVVTSVTTNAEGEAQFEIDDRYRGQSLIMVIKKDGREIERRRVLINQGSLDLDVEVPAAALTATVASAVPQTSSRTTAEYDVPLADPAESVAASSATFSGATRSEGVPSTGSSERDESWAGTYFGAAIGYGSGRSRSTIDHERRTRTETETTTRTTEFDFMNDRFVTREDVIVESVDLFEDAYGSGSDTNGGVVGDVYVGVNAFVAPRILAGVQVEGGVTDVTFDSRVSRERVRFKETRRTTTTSTVGDGPPETTSTSSMRSGTVTRKLNESSRLDLEWTLSVIGRAGWLATPETFLYGLAGWTYGHFEVDRIAWQGRSRAFDDFGSHGFVVGGGAETRLSPKWTLRAEYRYTQFADEDFTLRSTSGSGSVTDRLRGSFENDMHVGRMGVTRYFNLGLE